MELKEALQRFKSLNLELAKFTFDCGGDSMGNTEWELFNKEGNLVKDDALEQYFDNSVYEKVDFYVNSDGHYNGEAGIVEVTIIDDEEDSDFEYSKSAQSEYCESTNDVIEIVLKPEMVAFISANVLNINGGQDAISINYKHDVFLTDEEETLVGEIEVLIQEECRDFEPECDGEVEDWFTFTTNAEDLSITELTIKDNKLSVIVNKSFTYFIDSE